MCAKRRRWGHVETVVPGEVYRIHWPNGHKPDGSRDTLSETIYGTHDDADFALACKRIEKCGVDSDTTWAQFWEAKVVPTFDGLAERTKSDYTHMFDDHLRPRIGSEPVASMDYRRACGVLAEIEPPSAWLYSYSVLKKICNMAVREKLLASNPVDRSIPRKEPEPRPTHELLAEDIWPLLNAVAGTRYQSLILLAPVMGLRPEEVYALCSWDIRAIGRYAAVDVYKTVTVVDNKKLFSDKTKTPVSTRRTLAAEPFASLLLDAASGCDGPLFPGPHPKGTEPNATWFANPAHIRRNWQAWCERHGIDYIRPGDMRTIYSDWHGEAGTPDTLVSMSMGHKHPSTRGQNYMNWTRRDAERVADSMARYLVSMARCMTLNCGHRPPDWDAMFRIVPQIPKSSQFMARLSSDF